jgi:hypothetical protein
MMLNLQIILCLNGSVNVNEWCCEAIVVRLLDYLVING